MSKVLIVAEAAGGKLNLTTAKAVTCAQAIGGEIDLAVFTAEANGIADEAAAISGVTRVLRVVHPENAAVRAATLAPQIVALAGNGYTHVLAAGSTTGKDVMPRVAALLGVPQISDIMAVQGPHEFDRPIYAGNTITHVKTDGSHIVVGTVRSASFATASSGDGSAPIEDAAIAVELPTHTKLLDVTTDTGDRPDLQTASRVVSGGRGVGSEENFKIVYDFADKIGAAVGASRAAVDSGYCPNDMQVGQTGKIIAPELYIAFGISGAIQHLAGIKDAGCIVAINSDENAPIFEVADLGLVGDLFKVIPELEAALG